VTHDQLDRPLGIRAMELYFYLAARFDCANAACQLVRRSNGLLIKLGDNITQLQPGEISRTVIDYPSNLQTPSFCAADAAAPSDIAHSEKPLISRIQFRLKRRNYQAADSDSRCDRLLVTVELNPNFRTGLHRIQNTRQLSGIAHRLIAQLNQHIAGLYPRDRRGAIIAGQAGNKDSLGLRIPGIHKIARDKAQRILN
jgi:hypothetical protein